MLLFLNPFRVRNNEVPQTNPYYLAPEALAELKARAAEIRAQLVIKRAMRQARDAVAQTKRPLP